MKKARRAAEEGREMKNPTPSRPTTKSEPIDELRLSEDLSRRMDARLDAWIDTLTLPLFRATGTAPVALGGYSQAARRRNRTRHLRGWRLSATDTAVVTGGRLTGSIVFRRAALVAEFCSRMDRIPRSGGHYHELRRHSNAAFLRGHARSQRRCPQGESPALQLVEKT